MAQIAYKVSSVGDISKAFSSICSQTSEIIIAENNVSGEVTEQFAFAFNEEPNTYFTVHLANELNVRDTSYPYTNNTKADILFIKMYKYDTETLIYFPYIQYTIDYVCTSGQSAASQCYIGNLSGTLEVINALVPNSGDEYYLFFGSDWFGIVNWKYGGIVNYIVCSCRSEQHGDGGYILSSQSILKRQSDNMLFTKFWGGNLLCYYNKFGTYNSGYPVDYIDVSYCSIPYGSLTKFSEKIPPDAIRDYTIVEYAMTRNWYGHCTCSLLFDSNFTNKLPNYNNLVQFLDEEGCPVMSNTLNGISLLLPNYFFIDAAPLSTHEYRYVLDTPEMCYCSMYNMMGGNIVEQNYPTKGNKFMCFPLTGTNEAQRKAGYYKGFAFMLPIKYDEIIEDDVTLEPLKI